MIFSLSCLSFCFFFFNDTATTEIYTLSLHDALPILQFAPVQTRLLRSGAIPRRNVTLRSLRSEEHTSELQSQSNLVCRLLLEKKKKENQNERETEYKITTRNNSPTPLCQRTFNLTIK